MKFFQPLTQLHRLPAGHVLRGRSLPSHLQKGGKRQPPRAVASSHRLTSLPTFIYPPTASYPSLPNPYRTPLPLSLHFAALLPNSRGAPQRSDPRWRCASPPCHTPSAGSAKSARRPWNPRFPPLPSPPPPRTHTLPITARAPLHRTSPPPGPTAPGRSLVRHARSRPVHAAPRCPCLPATSAVSSSCDRCRR